MVVDVVVEVVVLILVRMLMLLLDYIGWCCLDVRIFAFVLTFLALFVLIYFAFLSLLLLFPFL